MGDWKVIRRNLKKSGENHTLELYNLTVDPEELNNVATDYPHILDTASEIFANQHIKSEIQEFRINSVENGLLSIQK